MAAFDDILKRHGLTARQIRDGLGVTSEAVRLWRHGVRKISIPVAIRMSGHFGIPLHELRPDVWAPPTAARTRRKDMATAA